MVHELIAVNLLERKLDFLEELVGVFFGVGARCVDHVVAVRGIARVIQFADRKIVKNVVSGCQRGADLLDVLVLVEHRLDRNAASEVDVHQTTAAADDGDQSDEDDNRRDAGDPALTDEIDRTAQREACHLDFCQPARFSAISKYGASSRPP